MFQKERDVKEILWSQEHIWKSRRENEFFVFLFVFHDRWGQKTG